MVAICHPEFTQFGVCHVTFVAMLFCLPTQKFTETGQLAAKSGHKTIFNMAAVRQLEF